MSELNNKADVALLPGAGQYLKGDTVAYVNHNRIAYFLRADGTLYGYSSINGFVSGVPAWPHNLTALACGTGFFASKATIETIASMVGGAFASSFKFVIDGEERRYSVTQSRVFRVMFTGAAVDIDQEEYRKVAAELVKMARKVRRKQRVVRRRVAADRRATKRLSGLFASGGYLGVPSIAPLISDDFLLPIKSPPVYLQMFGRGTRLPSRVADLVGREFKLKVKVPARQVEPKTEAAKSADVHTIPTPLALVEVRAKRAEALAKSACDTISLQAKVSGAAVDRIIELSAQIDDLKARVSELEAKIKPRPRPWWF